MKTALSVITLALSTGLPGAAEDVSPALLKPEKLSIKTAIKPCGKCSHAPCHCGFSPSYYTHYRPSRYPISSRLFRGVNSRVPALPPTTSTLVPTPRPANAVPSVTPTTSLGFVPRLSFDPPRRFDRDLHFRPTGALFGRGVATGPGGGHHRPGHGHDLLPHEKLLLVNLTQSRLLDTGTLVPTPRPPAAVPTAEVDETLGFDPSRSWLRFLTSYGHASAFNGPLTFDPPRRFDGGLNFRPTGALFGRSVATVGGHGSGRGRGHDFQPHEKLLLRNAGLSRLFDSNAVVPTPRPTRAVPAVTPKQSLGFDANRSWSRSLIRRGGSRGHGRGGRVPTLR